MTEKKQNIFKWFATVFCKEWVWQTFCVAWFWKTFCVEWIARGFFVNLVYKKFDKWKAWIYLSPALVLLAIFTVWPLINTVKMSFTSYYVEDEPIYEYDENGDPICDDDTGELKILGYGKWRGYSYAVDVGNKTAEEQGKYDEMVTFEYTVENFKMVIRNDGFSKIMMNTVILCVATVPVPEPNYG